MGLNIKNAKVEALAAEVARLAGESKTEAIRKALETRKQRLMLGGDATARARRVERLLREKIWPQVPARVRGKAVTKAEEAEILGYGPEGY